MLYRAYAYVENSISFCRVNKGIQLKILLIIRVTNPYLLLLFQFHNFNVYVSIDDEPAPEMPEIAERQVPDGLPEDGPVEYTVIGNGFQRGGVRSQINIFRMFVIILFVNKHDKTFVIFHATCLLYLMHDAVSQERLHDSMGFSYTRKRRNDSEGGLLCLFCTFQLRKMSCDRKPTRESNVFIPGRNEHVHAGTI